MVENRFDLAKQYADTSFAQAQAQVAALSAILNELEQPDVGTLTEIEIANIPPIDYGARPAIGTVNTDFGSVATRPPGLTLGETGDVDTSSVPVESLQFTPAVIAAPTIETQTPPVTTVNLGSVSIPSAPSMAFPEAPTFSRITFPNSISVDTPRFALDRPVLEAMNQPTGFNFTEAAYTSSIWSDLLAKVLNDIRNGGTGLNVNVEEGIFQRGLERMRLEHEKLYSTINEEHADLGFSLPTGVQAARLRAAMNEISRQRVNHGNEVMIKQAELAQANTQFIITKGVELEGMLRNFFNEEMTRTLEASREVARNSIEMYRFVIDRYNARLEGYKAEAAVFGERIRAELTRAEIYKAQMDGSRIEAEVQATQAAVYKARMDAVDTRVRIYMGQMQAAEIQSRIELSKVEVLKAQTEVYVAQLEGERVKVQGYASQVEAEKNRASAFAESVRAYTARVEAGKAIVETQIRTEELKLQQNQLLVEAYKADLLAYQADIEAELKNAGLVVEGFKAEVMAYTAENDAAKAENLVRIEEIKARIEKTRLELAKAEAVLKSVTSSYIALKELQLKGVEGIMNVEAQLAASSMNAVNASASFGYGGSAGFTETVHHNESLQESYSF
jgi:hypothetical protein